MSHLSIRPIGTTNDGTCQKARFSNFPPFLDVFQTDLHPNLILPIGDHRRVAVPPRVLSVSAVISRSPRNGAQSTNLVRILNAQQKLTTGPLGQ